MGLESSSRAAHVKESSEGTVVLDVEKQEIVEEAQGRTEETHGATTEYSHVIVALRKLESSLEEYLGNHIQETKGLYEATLSPVVKDYAETQHDNNSYRKKGPDHEAASHIYTHVEHIDKFLKSYVNDVRVLQKRLQQNVGQADNDDEMDEVKYRAMLDQFNMQLLVSTFTAGLILSWCSLVKTLQIDGSYAAQLYNVGLLLSLLAIGLHFFNIILSGRCVALCSDRRHVEKYTITFFYNVLETCEQLFLHGSLIFGVAVLEMSFIVFNDVIYPAVFCGVVALGIVVLVTGQFRKLSVMYQNVVRIKRVTWAVVKNGVGKRKG